MIIGRKVKSQNSIRSFNFEFYGVIDELIAGFWEELIDGSDWEMKLLDEFFFLDILGMKNVN